MMMWYHGTSVDAARAILASQFVGRAAHGRAYLAPLPGRVYLTQKLPLALSHAFNGLVEFDPLDGWRVHGRASVGAVIAVQPQLSTCVPDEDWLGEYLIDKEASTTTQPVLARLLRQVVLSMPQRTRDGWARYSRHQRWEYAIWARSGKTAINHLLKTARGRELLANLTELAPNIACVDSTVEVIGAWALAREHVHQLAPDGSNLDVIATALSGAD